nr:hypothetical protein BaRGS_016712 [Batillaria attramentaria]
MTEVTLRGHNLGNAPIVKLESIEQTVTVQVLDFLEPVVQMRSALRDGVKASIISNNDLSLGRVCTARDKEVIRKHSLAGNYARIIDGTFTTVTAGQKTEKKVTIKTLKEPLPDQGLLPAWASAALRECLRLHRHSDDNVLSIMGLALDKQKFHMVYPYMQNRTLKDHIIDTNKEFSVRQLVEFGLQVAEGLNYLAGKDITHRDLAARNCMVDSRQEVKITDAAFSWDFYEKEYVYDSARERYMPLRWMAPESLQDGYYDMRSDVWSLGVLLWELLTRGCLPFHEVEDQSVKEYVLQGYVLGQPQNCSDTLYDLMRQCWDLENEHRPHVSSVVTTLSTELTGGAMDQEDIYVNLGTTEGFYENQMALGGKSRRRAPPPPKTS